MPGSSPGMTTEGSPDVPQGRFDHLALVGRQSRLGRDGIADLVTLDRKPGLDAGGEVETGEGFVDAPEFPLQRHRLIPARTPAEVVELDALSWNDAGGPCHPPQAADQHHGRG